jgi:hypothetical protein
VFYHRERSGVGFLHDWTAVRTEGPGDWACVDWAGAAFLERIWFGKFIPALEYTPGIAPALGSAGMLMAAGMIAILLMRLIGGPSAADSSK